MKNKKLLSGMLLAVLLLSAGGWLAYRNSLQLIQTAQWVGDSQTLISKYHELLAHLVEAENGLFGLVITNQEEFLEPYQTSLPKIDEIVKQLEEMTESHPNEKEKLLELKDLIQLRMALIPIRLEARKKEGFAAAATLIQTKEAKVLMDRIRQKIATISLDQKIVLQTRQTESLKKAKESMLFEIFFGVASILLILISFSFLVNENAKRRESEDRLRRARDELDEKVRERTKEVQTLAETVFEKNRDLETLIYVASHDLRSPLVNIQGFSGVLSEACTQIRGKIENLTLQNKEKSELRTLLSSEVDESIKFIVAGIKKIDILLSGFLRFSRLGRSAIKIESLNMNTIMQEVKSALEYQLKEAGGTIQVDRLPSCSGDAAQINQVFSNLIDNAIKYRDAKRPLTIQISGRNSADQVVFSVKDNGRGIPKDQHSSIFEIFHRVDPSQPIPGDGLGLTIAKRIVERENGRIWLESEPDTGTTFFISLPKATNSKK